MVSHQIAHITDAKFILSSSSNLNLLMTVGRMWGWGGCSHRRAPGINELQIEVERRGWSVKRGAKKLKLSGHMVSGEVGVEGGRMLISQVTPGEIRRNYSDSILWFTGIGDCAWIVSGNKRRAELLLDLEWRVQKILNNMSLSLMQKWWHLTGQTISK